MVRIARRTRIPVEHIPSTRARKRRTIDKNQLTLALAGHLEHVFGYSFILTNLDVGDDEKLAEVEWWYRHRADIEALNKDAKYGRLLRHLPSKYHKVNAVWMWGALLACAISAWLQELAGTDRGNGRGRRTIARLRRELINVPARIIRSAGTTWLRLPPRRAAPGDRPTPTTTTTPPGLNAATTDPRTASTAWKPAHPTRQPGRSHPHLPKPANRARRTTPRTQNHRYSRIWVRNDRFWARSDAEVGSDDTPTNRIPKPRPETVPDRNAA